MEESIGKNDEGLDQSTGNWFDRHPEKIIGTLKERSRTGKLYTNKFGKPQPRLIGIISDVVAAIDVPDVQRFEHFVPRAIQNVQKVSAQQVNRVLELTKQEEKEVQIRLCNDELQCLDTTISKYNTDVAYKDDQGNTKYYTISEEEIKVWVTYQVQKGLYDPTVIRSNDWGTYRVENPNWKAWFEQDLVAYDGDEYVPHALFYSGNIYEKTRQLKSREDEIIVMVGQKGYEAQLQALEQIKPRPLLITDDPNQKLHLSPFDKIWSDINITELADGTIVEDNYAIGSIFYFKYLWGLSNQELTHDRKFATASDIYRHWIRKDRFQRGTSESEKAGILRNISIVGAVLFDRFLLEMLTRDDKNKVAALWNSKRNNYVPIPYYKIPVGFEVSHKFKGGQLKIRPAQREGVSFFNARGTGILGYDVGVGKTMTAILSIGDGFAKGMFKRPLIVVPQKVYKKWIAEISGVFAPKAMKINGKRVKKGDLIAEGILPHIKINDYDNLGTKVIGRAVNSIGITLQVEAYSITMVTYEGLVKIGFDESTEEGLAKRLKEALSQGETGRNQAIVEQRAEQWVDKALEGTELDIEQMGIDAIIVDEAHNFRNLFMEVRGDIGDDGEREKRHFMSGSSSAPSGRALSLFMLNAYVQQKHQLRNTFGLTATPFTNRATEIYSMMALYDYEGLKDFDVYNIAQFCITFIDETLEDTWTAAGKFKPNPVIRGYLNLPILQSIIFRSINYKTGEDANIQRPKKIILPLDRDDKGVPLDLEHIVQTKLQPTELQAGWLDEVTRFADGQKASKLFEYYTADSKGRVPGQILIALNAARAITFSPYSLKFRDEPMFKMDEITPTTFVDGSPKIKYTIECIRSVKAYHELQKTPVSGQIIYSDRGTEWFGHIQKYLVENVGFTPSEVAIFYGGVSKGRREKIKDGFLDGSIKVIIGSSTMREGVDLQKHGSVIYVCYLDWNPTDLHQLFGRIWRYGNKFSHIRIVVPLLENSSDVFTWQKLSEKMSRLNSIWTKANGTKMFEESELNAEELKRGLISDPEGLAQYAIDEVVQTNKIELSIAQGALTQLQESQSLKDDLIQKRDYLEKKASDVQNGAGRYDWNVSVEMRNKVKALEWEDDKGLFRLVRAYAKISTERYTVMSAVERYIKIKKQLARIEERILKRYQLTIYDDFSSVIEEYKQRESDLTQAIANELSVENRAAKIAFFTEEKAKEKAGSQTLVQRVAQFQRLNYLLDCKYGIHSCDIYGRVQEIKSGKTIALKEQEAIQIESSEYTMSKRLTAFMPPAQRQVVKELILGTTGLSYIESVLKPLEEQIAAIPKRQPPTLSDGKTDRNKDYSIVYAHFFFGGTDWFVIDWDGKDRFFCYVVLNGDYQMAELGYSSLNEIHDLSKTQAFGSELDFHWRPKYLPEALMNLSPSFYSRPIDPDWLPLVEMIQAGREDPVVGLNVKPKPKAVAKALPKPQKVVDPDIKAQIQQAIEGLQIALEFTESKVDQSKMSKALDGLQIALEFL